MLTILNPVPGTTQARNDGHYPGDSGCDINVPVGTPVVACADGEIVYSEFGHTPWVPCPTHPHDTPGSVLIRLAQPLVVDGRTYYYAWYTHMSRLEHQVPDGGARHPVRAGERLGLTGTGNDVPHLHFALLVDRRQRDEDDWMAPARVASLVWPSAPARPPLHITLPVLTPGQPGRTIACNPAIEDGVTRVDLRPLCDALGAELELHLEDGLIVVHPRQ